VSDAPPSSFPHATLLRRLRETILAFMLPSDDEAMVLVAYADVLREPLMAASLEGRAARLRAILVGSLVPSAREKSDLQSRLDRARALDAGQKELLKMSLFDLMIEVTRLEHAYEREAQSVRS
jgi:hypothetical protein